MKYCTGASKEYWSQIKQKIESGYGIPNSTIDVTYEPDGDFAPCFPADLVPCVIKSFESFAGDDGLYFVAECGDAITEFDDSGHYVRREGLGAK